MFGYFKRVLKNRKRQREAVHTAIRYFENAAQRKAIRAMSRIIATEKNRCIVRVCYGDTRPPHRNFYAIYDSPQEITELEFEEVAILYNEKPWR